MRRNETGMMISAEFCVTSGYSAYENWQFKFTKLQSKQSRGLRRNSNSAIQVNFKSSTAMYSWQF